METVPEGLDQDSDVQPFTELEELRGLIVLGRERGYLTFEQIAATLEEVEITKEQVSGLHAHLVEHGFFKGQLDLASGVLPNPKKC